MVLLLFSLSFRQSLVARSRGECETQTNCGNLYLTMAKRRFLCFIMKLFDGRHFIIMCAVSGLVFSCSPLPFGFATVIAIAFIVIINVVHRLATVPPLERRNSKKKKKNEKKTSMKSGFRRLVIVFGMATLLLPLLMMSMAVVMLVDLVVIVLLLNKCLPSNVM